MDSAKNKVVDHFAIPEKWTPCIAVMPIVGANSREVERRTVVEVSVRYACHWIYQHMKRRRIKKRTSTETRVSDGQKSAIPLIREPRLGSY
jgi:hypothetical protein